MIENDVMDIDETSLFLKVSKPALYKFIREGMIPAVKIGRGWKFHKSLLNEWLIKRITTTSQERANKTKRKNSLLEQNCSSSLFTQHVESEKVNCID